MKINFPVATEPTIALEALRPGQCFKRPGDTERRVFMTTGRAYGVPEFSAGVRYPKKVLVVDLETGKRLSFAPGELVVEIEAELTVTKIGRSA